uniref:Putative helicase n=1 Tax=viral metagenome TaxID=1070528 RepID=A0A6M3LVR9_9ZZZZ
MIALGTDIPSLSGLIYATPQSEVTQSKGRIERVLEGKKEPIVVDIVDTYYKDTMRWAKKREKSYIAEGLKIKVLK